MATTPTERAAHAAPDLDAVGLPGSAQATSATSRHTTVPPETTYYVYDAGGQRVRKVTELTTGQIKEERTYLAGVEVCRKYGANPLVRETLHVMDDKQRIAIVETRTQGDDGSLPELIRYQFGNHLGSASLELDHQAQVISYEEYYPYGSTSYQAVRSQTETPKRYRYTGMERDEESGLNYHGARYYAPWLGRWLSADPTDLHDGSNLYAYVNGRPLTQTDRTGFQGEQQLSFSEHPVYDFVAIATKTGRGFTKAMYETAAKLKAIWGGPDNFDLGHLETSFSRLRAGEPALIRIQPQSINRSQGDRLDVSGRPKVRVNGIDPAAPSGVETLSPPANRYSSDSSIQNFEQMTPEEVAAYKGYSNSASTTESISPVALRVTNN